MRSLGPHVSQRPHIYQRRPGRVEAMQINLKNIEAVAKWCGGKTTTEINPNDPMGTRIVLYVPVAPHGVVRAVLGDYVVKGKDDEFWTVPPDIFESAFEEYLP